MATISSNVSKKEADVIREYANACGEIMSDLIRKILLTDATFMNFYRGSKLYDCEISIPDGISGEEEDQIVLHTRNKIRRILGLEEQTEI